LPLHIKNADIAKEMIMAINRNKSDSLNILLT